MKISLLTDAPKHNLALMRLSAYHKAQGDSVLLNMPLFPADYRYASILFERNKKLFHADEYGGSQFPETCLPDYIESMKPDYELYENMPFSLGYTFRPCFNTCDFCVVPTQNHPDVEHHSIWEFHDSRFDIICLLNNNTFQDPCWKETFQEIWDEKLIVFDQSGYDLRLIDDEKAEALKKTKFTKRVHFAWDRIQDESLILSGLEVLKKHKIYDQMVYVIIGYNSTIEEDIHRCQKLIDYKQNVYIMIYKKSKERILFKRFMNSFMWKKYKTIKEGWENFNK